MALNTVQIATGPLADLGYVEEASYGSVPPSPVVKVCRRRSTTLTLTKEEYSSEEVRSDRMVSDSRHGIRRANGEIVTEISAGGHADFYEALLGGSWATVSTLNVATGQTPLTISDLGDGTFKFDGANFTSGNFMLGDTLTFASTTKTYLDGKIFTLVAIDGSNDGIFMAWDGFLEAAEADLPYTTTAGTLGLSGKRCVMGNISRSFTMERAFTDLGKFIYFTGERINSAAIDLPTTGIATCTFGVVGKDASSLQDSSIDGASSLVIDDGDVTSLTFLASAKTITVGSGDLVALGLAVGDKIAFEGAGITDAQNRNIKTIEELTSTVITTSEAIVSGGAYTSPFTITRVGSANWTAAATNQVLVSASGILAIDGVPAATVTAMNFTIDNQMAGSGVVGENVVPDNLWGNQCMISGELTVLFDRGGMGETLYNAFDDETEVSTVMRLDSSDGTKAVTFYFPRAKINTGNIGDAVAEGLPVSIGFRALKPNGGKYGSSQIVISDSAAS